MMRTLPAPVARAASMKVDSRTESTCDLTCRARLGQPTTAMTKMIVPGARPEIRGHHQHERQPRQRDDHIGDAHEHFVQTAPGSSQPGSR